MAIVEQKEAQANEFKLVEARQVPGSLAILYPEHFGGGPARDPFCYPVDINDLDGFINRF